MIDPKLLYLLAKAGEDDTIVLAGNGFPGDRLVKDTERIVNLDGLSIPVVLKEVMKLITVCILNHDSDVKVGVQEIFVNRSARPPNFHCS